MAVDVGTLVMKFKADDSDLTSKLEKNETQVKKFGMAAKAGALIAVAAFAKIASSSIKLYQEQEKAETRLEAIAKNVTGATDEQIESMKKLASVTQNLSTFGDEVVIAGQSQILSFGVSTKSAEKLTGSLADLMAAQYGMNATQEQAIQSANMFGKALNGQSGALSRAGILLNDQQAELLKTGDEMTRVNTLTEIMEQNYGGLAQELAGTTGGQMIQFKNALGDLGEQFGKVLIPVAMEFITILNGLIAPISAVFNAIERNSESATKSFVKMKEEEIASMQSTLREQQKIASQSIIEIQKEKDAFVSAEIEKLNVQKDLIGKSVTAEKERVNDIISQTRRGAAARIESLRESQEEYNENIDEQMEREQEILDETIERYDEELEEFENMKNKELELLDKQYNAQVKLLDAESQEKIKKLNIEIEKIEATIEAEQKAKEEAKNKEERSDLELAVTQAKTREEKQEAETKLANFIAELKAEKLEEEREAEIQSLEDKISNVEDETDAKKDEIEKQFEASKTAIEDELTEKRTATQDAIDEYIKETNGIIEELSTRKELYNDDADEKIKAIQKGSAAYVLSMQDNLKEFNRTKDEELLKVEELQDKIEEEPSLGLDTTEFDEKISQANEDWDELQKNISDDIKAAKKEKEAAEKAEAKKEAERTKYGDVTAAGSGFMGGLGTIISGNRATGGEVKAGSTYLVGEKGVETFTPSKDGNISSNKPKTEGTIISNNFKISNLVVREEADIKKIARELFNMQKESNRGYAL